MFPWHAKGLPAKGEAQTRAGGQMTESKNSETFINGEAQAAEILAALSQAERQRILMHISIKNPQVARELSRKSFGFNALSELNEVDFDRLSRLLNPKILGIALKGASIHLQRTVLSKLDRSYAEVSYDALTSPQMNEPEKIQRARDRVVETISELWSEHLVT